MNDGMSNGDISRRLDRFEKRLDSIEQGQMEIKQALAEFRGGKRVILWMLGGLGTVGAVIAAKADKWL